MKSSKHTYQGVKQFEVNRQGRDLIVGDIHGCFKAWQQELKRMKFDPSVDRLFSVGDLIDRGPNPFEVVKFCQENNVHVVLGNHELSFLSMVYLMDMGHDLRNYEEAMNSAGHQWMLAYSRAELEPLVQYFCTLPYIMYVEHPELPFFIVHASITQPITGTAISKTKLLNTPLEEPTTSKAAEILRVYNGLLFSRSNQKLLKSIENTIETTAHGMFDSCTVKNMFMNVPAFDPNKPFAYCGHTIFNHPTLINNHLHIDTGAFLSEPEFAIYRTDGYITIFDHELVVKTLL